MAHPRTASPRTGRHVARFRGWAQLPWTLLGMAFVTALFLVSYQLQGPVQPTLDLEQPASYDGTVVGR